MANRRYAGAGPSVARKVNVVGGRNSGVLLLLLALFAGFGAVAETGDNTYVRTRSDLQRHYRLHIFRTRRLGLALYDMDPSEFPGVTRDQVDEFLTLHDRAKLDSSAKFQQRFWADPPGGQAILDRLFAIYGVGYSPADPAVQANVLSTVRSLNAADRNVGRAYFNSQGMIFEDGQLTNAARSLLRLEHIADIVDRASDPVTMEEFRLEEGNRPPLSKFLSPEDEPLARRLQQRYGEIVSGLEYASRTLLRCRYFELAPQPLTLVQVQ